MSIQRFLPSCALSAALVSVTLTLIGGAAAQQPVWTRPGSSPATTPAHTAPVSPAQAPAAQAVPTQAVPTQAVPTQASPAQVSPAQQARPTEAAPAVATKAAAESGEESTHNKYYRQVAGKKGKFEYIGPKDVVELAPTPMLDQEGRQRIDPDGKPMFNPAVRQQRDKHGNPLFDQQARPIFQATSDLGYDDKGKKLHGKKEKPPKLVSVNIERGTLTVDGLTGKAGLNYDIKDLKFIYIYAPWIGITIVSHTPFPGAIEQKNAFNDKTLTVSVEEHTLQVYSDKRLMGKQPESAFVAVDRDFKVPSTFPVMGYGETLKAPYAWPGSRENAALKGPIAPPPLPPSVRPATLLQPCPAGQMRMPGRTPLPGENLPSQPCVAITKALPGTGAPKQTTPAPAPAQQTTPRPAESVPTTAVRQ